jgi:protease II
MSMPWLKNKNCIVIEIKKFKSISNCLVVDSIIITDTETIHQIINKIEQIPSNGSEMIEFNQNAERIDVLFYSKSDPQRIQIIAGSFKTPTTGFNSLKGAMEIDLYNEIKTLLYFGN